jgi:hypothetical protein
MAKPLEAYVTGPAEPRLWNAVQPRAHPNGAGVHSWSSLAPIPIHLRPADFLCTTIF